ncbi:hypothetical protein PRZ48_012159 [Zasmidium cellare]|uniref:FAD-binding domain-containing protein n=1 Tax=Zasmidium cellare TaxID=395010 RepID=A0ABR0E437_ZASCE|nr:hypothetical protein PRZ48_012159 [Zasmidium cellare]
MAGMECLRAIGLEKKATALGYSASEYSTYTRLCNTLAGEEIYRSHVFGNDPHRHVCIPGAELLQLLTKVQGDYDDASPSKTMCLSQTELEPLLLEYASDKGVPARWQTRLVTFAQDKPNDTVLSVVEDLSTGREYVIRSKHMVAADGAKSQIIRDLKVPLVKGPGNGFVICMWIEADLSHLVEQTPSLLNYLCLPGKPQPEYGPVGIAHFIKPYNEWVISLFPSPTYTKMEATEDQVMSRIRELVGDDSVEMKVKGMSIWDFDEVYAEYFTDGNIHGVGNSVHRHPPFGGLGTSTCLEDSFNLGWKLAHVLQGKADRSLLDTYNQERQPAGSYVVKRTNENGRLNFNLYGMLGYFDNEGPEYRMRIADLLKEDSEDGAAMRDHFRMAMNDLADERHCVGAMMNQWYESSAVYLDDETRKPVWPSSEKDRATKLYTSTYPGWRVPHAWLGVHQPTSGPRLPLLSTRDIVGNGNFTILTGIGGKSVWGKAAEEISQLLGITIAVISIGWGQDYEDTFFRWYETRGVEEKGAVLVRPDHTVAWRAVSPPGDASATQSKLETVLRSILGRALPKRKDSKQESDEVEGLA